MSTELQPIERAEQVLGFVERKAQLTELAGKSASILEITNAAGFQECHAARMRLKNTRVTIQNLGKEAREDATKFSKAVIAKENELIAVIKPEEERLELIQDAYEAARAAERAERERLERERTEAILKRIHDVRHRPLAMVGKPADVIKAAIEDLQSVDLSDLPDEYQPDAQDAMRTAVERLSELHNERVAAAVEAQRIAEERAELDRRRQGQEAEERAAREQREREEAEHKLRLEAEEAERREQEERERAERQRQEDEARAQRQREEDAARAEREREAAAAQERQRAEDARLQAEREAIERDRRERERAAREKEIAEATLYGAACEAVDLLHERGLADHIVTQKLEAALGREKPIREAA